MTDYTPGPWKVNNELAMTYIEEVATGISICRVSDHNQIANAPLIAAAPELLELLEECVVYLEVFIKGYYDNIDPERDFDTIKADEELDMQIVHNAKDFIAKAKGETK